MHRKVLCDLMELFSKQVVKHLGVLVVWAFFSAFHDL